MKKAILTYMFGHSFVSAMLFQVVLPLLLASMGLSEDKIGLFYMIATLIAGVILVGIFTLSDYRGTRFVFLITILALVAASFLFASKVLTLVIIGMVLASIANDGKNNLSTIFSIKYRKSEVSRTEGHQQIMITSAAILAPIAAGIIAEHYGFTKTAIICGIVSICLIFIMLRIHEFTRASQKKPKLQFKICRKHIALTSHGVLANIAINLMWAFAVPLYFKVVHNLTPQGIGICLGITATAGMIGGLFGWLADKYNFKLINYAGLFVASLSWGTMYFISNLYVVLVFLWLGCFSLTFASIALARFYGEFVRQHGREISLMRAITYPAGAVAAAISGYIIVTAGYRSVFIVAAMVLLASIVPLVIGFSARVESKI